MNLQARRLREQDAKEYKRKHPELSRLVRAIKSERLRPEDVAEIASGVVLKELNGNPTSASSKRVARFIELYARARGLHDSFRLFFETEDQMVEFLHRSPSVAKFGTKQPHYCTGYTFKIPEIQALNEQLNLVLTELNTLLRRYRWFPVVRHMGFEMSQFEVTEDWLSHGRSRGSWEIFAIWWLCNSRNAQWIDFFRHCPNCKKWFFAAVAHQTYCTDACRKQNASKSPEFKERRAVYMRKYRRDEKVATRKSKESIKRSF